MIRVLILVEGQAEETSVRDVLAPHLAARGVWPQAVIMSTKRVKSGQKFKGGVTSYEKAIREIRLLLGDTSARLVTTMLDLYGLPRGFPGLATAPSAPASKAAHLEAELARRVNDVRFRAYLSLHEFEALLFTDSDAIVDRVVPGGDLGRAGQLRQVRSAFTGPEDIDDDPQTAPSKRILAVLPQYDKVRHGPLIAEAITLDRIRAACPHFDSWLRDLEQLTSAR